jgi:hypothetical protein
MLVGTVALGCPAEESSAGNASPKHYQLGPPSLKNDKTYPKPDFAEKLSSPLEYSIPAKPLIQRQK